LLTSDPNPPARAPHTLSLRDALPICPDVAVHDAQRGERERDEVAAAPGGPRLRRGRHGAVAGARRRSARDKSQVADLRRAPATADRKSTRLNSSHVKISYAVFCLKKK